MVPRTHGELAQELMAGLKASGTKISTENVAWIGKTQQGKTVWLESGSESAGLEHILIRHGDDFANKGVTASEIPDLLSAALTRGVIGKTTSNGAAEYTVEFGRKIQKLQITVSKNGFIVGANPLSGK